MALLGTYVGVIPVALGMLFLPFIGRAPASWVRVFMAFTIGLLGFLAVDGYPRGLRDRRRVGRRLRRGRAALPRRGARLPRAGRRSTAGWRAAATGRRAGGASGYRLALMIAIGIGLHNLGEGLAIGSAYSVGALALGAFLVIGFAIHNTTEGFAIVAPLAGGERPSLARVGVLGVIAGAPAILGARDRRLGLQPRARRRSCSASASARSSR